MSLFCRTAAAMLLLAAALAGQRLYVGVKGGTPLSGSRLETSHFSRTGGGPYRLDVRRYTIGPSVEVSLPWFGIGVGVDALYKRFDTEDHWFLAPTFGTIYRSYYDSWEFPITLRHAWRVGAVAPFAAVGGAMRVVHGGEGVSESFNGFPGQPQGIRTSYPIDYTTVQGGWVAGSGVRFGVYRGLKLTPEIRYTRYTSGRLLPTQNQVEFLLGLGF